MLWPNLYIGGIENYIEYKSCSFLVKIHPDAFSNINHLSHLIIATALTPMIGGRALFLLLLLPSVIVFVGAFSKSSIMTDSNLLVRNVFDAIYS